MVLEAKYYLGGRFFHQGDPVWAFTNDAKVCESISCRFEVNHLKNSLLDYRIWDVDAVYFAKGVKIIKDGKEIASADGEGTLRFHDFCFLQTYYVQGMLTVFIREFLLCPKQPEIILNSNIWNMNCVEFSPRQTLIGYLLAK